MRNVQFLQQLFWFKSHTDAYSKRSILKTIVALLPKFYHKILIIFAATHYTRAAQSFFLDEDISKTFTKEKIELLFRLKHRRNNNLS